MSRGRGGPSKEHYYWHPTSHLQAKENFCRSGPGPVYHRAGPQQFPHSSYYSDPAYSEVPIQPSSPLNTYAAPAPSHTKAVPKSVAHYSSHNQNYGASPGPSSFHEKQKEFLTGQIPEAPQFRAAVRGGGGGGVVPNRVHSSVYQPHLEYSRYPNPSSTPRGRASCSQDQRSYRLGAGTSRGSLAPRHSNQSQFQAKNYNQPPNRQWRTQTDSLCDAFHGLMLKDKPKRGRERFDRHSSSSSPGHLSFAKGNVTLTPQIQDKVHRALAILKPSESICAKVLAKKLHLPKKIVNQALYSLERSQKASKQGLTPPEWTLYREPLGDQKDQSFEVQSPPSHLSASSEAPEKPEETLETDKVGQAKEEDSDTESSSSFCASLEFSDSEDSQSSANGQHHKRQHPSATSSPDQEPKAAVMGEQKEAVLTYLFKSGEATALSIAKNIGLKTAKQVNPTLYALEKQGEVIKNGEVNPATWELSTHRRERMERSLKAAQSTPALAGQNKVEASNKEEGERAMCSPSPLPPLPGLEVLKAGWMQDQILSEVVSKVIVFALYIYIYILISTCSVAVGYGFSLSCRSRGSEQCQVE